MKKCLFILLGFSFVQATCSWASESEGIVNEGKVTCSIYCKYSCSRNGFISSLLWPRLTHMYGLWTKTGDGKVDVFNELEFKCKQYTDNTICPVGYGNKEVTLIGAGPGQRIATPKNSCKSNY